LRTEGIPVLDLIIIVAYLAGILAAGIWSTRKQSQTSNNYFLAGRSLNWAMVGSALFAANISTIHLVGLAASGYNEGLVWGNFEWMATFTDLGPLALPKKGRYRDRLTGDRKKLLIKQILVSD